MLFCFLIFIQLCLPVYFSHYLCLSFPFLSQFFSVNDGAVTFADLLMVGGDTIDDLLAFCFSFPSWAFVFYDAACDIPAWICMCMNPEPIQIDRLTKRNLNQFIETLQSDRPLFCIDASLSTPYIILQPSGTEVYNTIMEVVKGFLERYNNAHIFYQ